jgi:hypothetical protein
MAAPATSPQWIGSPCSVLQWNPVSAAFHPGILQYSLNNVIKPLLFFRGICDVKVEDEEVLRIGSTPGSRRFMLSLYLLPENIARQDGFSEVIALGSKCGKPLLLTLGITRIVEQESLELLLWGSADQREWIVLAAFPKKFYCGDYPLLLDLARHPEVRFLRSQWKLSCWGYGAEATPLFGFYLTAEDPKLQAVGAA